MKIIFKIILTIAAIVIFNGCLTEPNDLHGLINGGCPIIDSDSVGIVKTHSIEIFSRIAKQNGARIDSCGFYVIKDETTDTTNFSIMPESAVTAPFSFNAVINGLEANTAYKIISYAKNSEGFTQGTPIKITTLNGLGYIKTIPVDSIKGTSAISGGIIDDDGEGQIIHYGIIISRKENMSPADTLLAQTKEDNSFLVKANKLDTTSTYYVQAFAENTYGIFKGEIRTFVTKDGKPEMGDFQVLDVQFVDAAYSASIVNNGDSDIISKGICWVEYPNIPTIENNITENMSDDFNGLIEDLASGVHYNARAYAINTFGISYSEIFNFVTENDTSMVTIDNIGIPNEGYVMVNATIHKSGKGSITGAGVCWAGHNLPSLNDSVRYVPGQNSVTPFTCSAVSLKGDSVYYIRAFAQNSEGETRYSTVREVKTPPIFYEMEAFPGGTRLANSVTSFTFPGSINATYILGGDIGTNLSNELWTYNASNRWNQMASIPGGGKKWQSAAAAGTLAYVFGGVDQNGATIKNLYRYYPSNNHWEEITPASSSTLWPTPVHSAAAATVNYNSVYFVGGNRNGVISNEVWAYNATYNRWERKTDFPVRQYKGIAVGALYSNTIYVGLGLTDVTGTTSEKRLWSYSEARTSGNEWQLETIFPGTGQIRSAAYLNSKDRIYIVDDEGGLWMYNITKKTWTQKTPLPPSNRGDYQHCMFILDNNIYIGFGPSYRSLVKYDYTWDLQDK